MSRIHEALKKAELEKRANVATKRVEESKAAGVVPASISSTEQSDPHANSLDFLAPSISPPIHGKNSPDGFGHEDSWAKFLNRRWDPDHHQIVFGNSDSFPRAIEQFRTLRSRLYRVREAQPLQTLLISSAISGEGKSLVAANLAHAFVRQHGCRALLIDADLRAPRLHTLLGAPQTPGLADFLKQSETTEIDIIQRGNQGKLCFIPAGNRAPNPSELISTGRLKYLLDRIKPLFDWIIIDSPPALPVADASILSGVADGVLLVVRERITPSEVAQKAIREFPDSRVIGVVLNSVKETAEYAHYYGYGDRKGELNLGSLL